MYELMVLDYSCLMSFIARCGFLVLSVLVIFALFEVRYDTLRRCDNDAAFVRTKSIAFFRA